MLFTHHTSNSFHGFTQKKWPITQSLRHMGGGARKQSEQLPYLQHRNRVTKDMTSVAGGTNETRNTTLARVFPGSHSMKSHNFAEYSFLLVNFFIQQYKSKLTPSQLSLVPLLRKMVVWFFLREWIFMIFRPCFQNWF